MSFRSATLGQLTTEALSTMLGEGETLFVEYKTDIAKGKGKTLSVAVASLANSLGGWVLIGVRDDGTPIPEWEPPAGELVDTVRQRLESNIDPMPSFAARVAETAEGHRVGVVRVYESADTPHLVDGTVYVREPAKNKKNSAQPPYEPTAVRSHYELAQLVRRGLDAGEDARRRVAEATSDTRDGVTAEYRYINEIPGLRGSASDSPPPGTPAISLTLAPLTMTEPWRSWQVSSDAPQTLGRLAERLVTSEPGGDGCTARIHPRPGGLTAISQGESGYPWIRGASMAVHHFGYASADRIGFLQVRLFLPAQPVSGSVDSRRDFADGSDAAKLGRHALTLACDTLAEVELLGRYAAYLTLQGADKLYSRGIHDAPVPRLTNYDGQITVDGRTDLAESPDVDALATRWHHELCRAAGMAVWT